MKIKEGFELHNVCGENVIIASGIENLDYSKLINLNESATYLWEALVGKVFSVEDMAALLCQEYDVDEAVALQDAKTLLDEWVKQGLCEV
jgi:hypothetical protein